MNQLSVTGGARVGWVNASWPLAQLSVSDGRLRLYVFLIGQYDFAPEDVIAFENYGFIPVLASGVRIAHRRTDYPPQIIFWSTRPNRLIERIGQAGFIAKGTPEPVGPVQIASGWLPVRWQPIAAVIVAWNLLLAPYVFPVFLNRQPPRFGIGFVLAPAMVFALALATKTSRAVQRLVLKEGRSVGEISPILNLLLLVAGFMTVLFPVVLFGLSKSQH